LEKKPSVAMHPPTEEQLETIRFSENLQSFKISAYAGAGKTTTLTKISDHLYNNFGLKGLYIAFNKAIADEAKTKLHESVECRTFHSLAYRNVGYALTSKVKYKRQFHKELVAIYAVEDRILPTDSNAFDKYIKFNDSRSLKKKNETKKSGYQNFSAEMQIQAMQDTITAFCRSTDVEIKIHHVRLPKWASKDDSNEEISDAKHLIYHYARNRWNELIDVSNEVAISHDVYLKIWSLSNPKIQADYILFDESQDADNVQLEILSKQDCPIIYVGDMHQSIYEWRGAVNAMEKLEIPELHLTQSFRFGCDIALHANKILGLLGESLPLRGFSKIKSNVFRSADAIVPDAILCRTNKGAFNELIQSIRKNDGRKYSIQTNIEEIISFIENAEKLKNGEKIDHIELNNFDTWEVLMEYTELNPQDQNVSGLVRIINEFKNNDLLIQTLKNCSKIEDADCVICTAHKSKGLEWDSVKISDDFNLGILKNEKVIENLRNAKNIVNQNSSLKDVFNEVKKSITEISDAELRLLYVATTRAKKQLDISNIIELYDLIDFGLSQIFDELNESLDLKAGLI
jgi:superfamily I DNA/RNA helicase